MQATTTQGITFDARSVRPSTRAMAAGAVLIGTMLVASFVANALSVGPTTPRSEVRRPAAEAVAAGQAELDGWVLEAPITVPAGPAVVGGRSDQRAVVDPVAAGQAELDGWVVEGDVTAPANEATLDSGSGGAIARPGVDPVVTGRAQLEGWIVR